MNENKTNAPIKLPVRVVNNWLQDCNGKTIADLSDHNTKEVNEHVVAALNEADALRAEVEAYQAMLSTFDVRLLGLRGNPCAGIWRDENGVVKYRHANDHSEQLADSMLDAYAALKAKDIEGDGE